MDSSSEFLPLKHRQNINLGLIIDRYKAFSLIWPAAMQMNLIGRSESALLAHWDIINNKDHQKLFIIVVHLFIL